MKWINSIIAIIGFISWLCASHGTSPDNHYTDIILPPVATFSKYCSRCHGFEGSAYGKDFGTISDDSLKGITEDMMFGPAGLNPDSISIAAMVAYNRALSRKIPFASVLNTRAYFDKHDSFLSIEASPAAIVDGADPVRESSINALVWRLPYDSTQGRILQITVTRSGVSSFIQFPDELWSR